MSSQLTRDNVSPLQARRLQMARTTTDPYRALALLEEQIEERSVRFGEETVHPDWLDVYSRHEALLYEVLSVEHADVIREFFDNLKPFDEEVRTISPSSEKIAFLLGAGASKPEPSGIPTVVELLPDLLVRGRRLDREDVTLLADFCDETGIKNIEDLLTAAQISEFCSKNSGVLSLVDYLLYRRQSRGAGMPPSRDFASRRQAINVSSVALLQDTLGVLFGLLSSRMLPAQPNAAHLAIAGHAQEHPPTVIVTTNYDCCMDRALDSKGECFSYRLEFANGASFSKPGPSLTALIKLHGSLNWFYCETCQSTHLIDIEKTVREYLSDQAAYPVIGVCKDCGGQRRGLLVPPLAMKFDMAPPLTPLLEEARVCFQAASLLVVVGFSFADADLYISRMLSRAMQSSDKMRLIVFDRDRSVADKVRRQFTARIPNFDRRRVLWVSGDCSKTLPAFLAGELHKTGEAVRQQAPRREGLRAKKRSL